MWPLDENPALVSWVHRVRPEGRVHELSVAEKLAYLWKYLLAPRESAEPALMAHFEGQKALQVRLRAEEAPEQWQARLGFVGDLMWIRTGWKKFLPENTRKELCAFDGLVGNLETVISHRFPVPHLPPDALRFNSPEDLVTAFRRNPSQSLFAALSLANNHILDFREEGALDTLNFLRREGIAASGVTEHDQQPRWETFTRNGIRFGFFAGCFGMNQRSLLPARIPVNALPGLAPETERADLSPAFRALKEMQRSGVHVKIVYLHWGSEFELYPSARTMRLARELVQEGADVVAGSHPHVPQPAEVLFLNHRPPLASPESCLKSRDGRPRRAVILYSLGNFTTNMFTLPCKFAPLAELGFRLNNKGEAETSCPRFHYFYNRNRMVPASRSLLPLRQTLPGSARAEALMRHLEHV